MNTGSDGRVAAVETALDAVRLRTAGPVVPWRIDGWPGGLVGVVKRPADMR